MNDLHITLIQSDIFWEDATKNNEHFGQVIDALPTHADLIILPEMFNTGFSVNPGRCAEKTGGPTMDFMKQRSAEWNCMISGSIMIAEEDSFFNRLICMRPDGNYDQYDKRHLFRLSEEYRIMKSGREKKIVNLKSWNILPLVCYDLRFPVWSRNTWMDGIYEFDILIYVANWPKSRGSIWQSLLIARAIENQCYVIGVNRIGKDGFGTAHCGNSMIVNPDGTVLASATEDKPAVLQSSLSIDKLREFRKSYPFAPDWDHFAIQL
jgi:predicted amidohydrolase